MIRGIGRGGVRLESVSTPTVRCAFGYTEPPGLTEAVGPPASRAGTKTMCGIAAS